MGLLKFPRRLMGAPRHRRVLYLFVYCILMAFMALQYQWSKVRQMYSFSDYQFSTQHAIRLNYPMRSLDSNLSLMMRNINGSQAIEMDRRSILKQDIPLVTIFTTFKNDPDRFLIHNNTIHNWSSLRPYVVPILFTIGTDPKLVDLARNLGWIILPAPKVNRFRTPFFKDMYLAAQRQVRSNFYGYSNGDILFDYSLISSLVSVREFIEMPEFNNNQTLVIGRRTNFDINNRTLQNPYEVSMISQEEGTIFMHTSSDYFFISNNSFPWQKLPPIVVGRAYIDLILADFAMQENVLVMDATKTLNALHQTGSDGNRAWRTNTNTENRDFNIKQIENTTFRSGRDPLNPALETKFDENYQVVVSYKWTNIFDVGMVLSQP